MTGAPTGGRTGCAQGPDSAGDRGGTDGGGLPDEAYLAALAGLPHLTPSRLRQLLFDRSPTQAWRLVSIGRCLLAESAVGEAEGPDPGSRLPRGGNSPRTPSALTRAWRIHAGRTDPAMIWADYRVAGVRVWRPGGPGFPGALNEDPQAPSVLFSLGSLAACDHPRVAVVGTRNCTHYGEDVACELGAGLAGAGVSVVSGLALGIDGAAHRGALVAGGAPPLAVVGSGLDVVYPLRQARLWAQLAAVGGILSEAPLGSPPEPWRFPWRNRLIAALSDVVVVVESHAGGGALLTVDAAMRRGVAVMAVPGSVRSPASAGTNALIADGCAPARDTGDVLVALGLSRAGWAQCSRTSPRSVVADADPTRRSDVGGELVGVEREVWRALDSQSTPTDVIMRRTGRSLGEVAAALGRLEEAGLASAGDGWWERSG